MSFRRDAARAYQWSRWRREHDSLIRAAGLPTDVVATQRAFEYLLGHGYNQAGWWNQAPWFEVYSQTPEQFIAFQELLADYERDVAPRPAGWVALYVEQLRMSRG